MIGEMTERVAIERRDRTPDTGGGAAVAWTAVATVWAKVTARPRADDVESEGRRAVTVFELTIRRRTDVTAAMRGVWRGRALYFRGLADEGPHAPYLRIAADDGDPL
jgi:SPP1 family predicted phage head-tail adaptor